MGAVMSLGLSAGTMLATQAACCFSSAACRCLGSISCASSTATRVAYSVLFLANALVSWGMLSDVVGKQLSKWTHGYLKLNCTECVGTLAVHRVCFALTVFHLGMALALLGIKTSRDRRAGWQNGFWGPKLALWLLLVIVSFFIPNEFFVVWGNYFAMVGAGIFVVLQLGLLIDFAHSFSESLLESYAETESRASIATLIGMTVGLIATALTLTIIMFVYFGGAGCKLNQFFISFNLILCFAACMLSIAPFVQEATPRAGLAQASIVVAYASYLILSAVANAPVEPGAEQCNPVGAARGSRTVSVALGTIFTFLAILWSTSAAAVQSHKVLGYDAIPDAEEASMPLLGAAETGDANASVDPALVAAVESGALPASALEEARRKAATATTAGPGNTTVVVVHAGPSDSYPTEDEARGVAYNYAYFHIVFALAAMYLAMLVTSWNTVTVVGRAPAPAPPAPTPTSGWPSIPNIPGLPGQPTPTTPGGSDDDDGGLLVEVGKGWGAVWVKVVSSWFAIVLYAWTLLGPVVMADREW